MSTDVNAWRAILTRKMVASLHLAARKGAVFAGNDVYKGALVRTSATVLFALKRRGLLDLRTSPDGGIMGKLTVKGAEVEAALAELEGAA